MAIHVYSITYPLQARSPTCHALLLVKVADQQDHAAINLNPHHLPHHPHSPPQHDSPPELYYQHQTHHHHVPPLHQPHMQNKMLHRIKEARWKIFL
jgi:hypothetical protein